MNERLIDNSSVRHMYDMLWDDHTICYSRSDHSDPDNKIMYYKELSTLDKWVYKSMK